jgi:hypothetical protein
MHGTKNIKLITCFFPRLGVKNLGSLSPLCIDLYDLVVKTELDRFTAVLRFCYRELSFVLREENRLWALRIGC